MTEKTPSAGLTVDAQGDPAVDPTKNVIALVDKSVQRLDDLRSLSQQMADKDVTHLKEIGQLREDSREKLAHAESSRLDSIRQVDREDVNKTAAAAQAAIGALASTTTTVAETLRNQVATTAAAQEARRAADNAEIVKRLSALELSSSEGKGKQSFVDPQMDRLTKLVEDLARAQSAGKGKDEGVSSTWALIAAAVALVVGLGGLYFKATATPPQIVYAPAAPPVAK